MLKNLMIYRMGAEPQPDLDTLDNALQDARFVECGASQEQSMGWVPPRGDANGSFAESVAGELILKFRIETKSVPATAVRKKADEEAARIEETTGRKPGKKEMRDIREDAKRALLPHAFSKFTNITAWIDRKAGLLVMDATSQSRADAVITALVEAAPTLAPRPFNTRQTPQSAMALWLSDGEAPGAFQIEQEAELKSWGEDKAVVKYGRHSLDIDEVKQHIAQGKLPRKLALNWQGRVAFTLTESMTLKKVELLDVAFENSESKSDSAADHFDADMAITTGELRPLISDLVCALGGELSEFSAAPAHTQATRTPPDENTAARMTKAAHNPDGDGPDPLIETTRELVLKDRKASISYVQRKLQIGYNRAARLLEALEIEGVVTPLTSAGVRDVRATATA